MDYESLQQILQAPEVIYGAVAVASATLGLYAGRLFYRNRLRHAEIAKDVALSSDDTRRAEIELEKLRIGDADNRHRRKKEIMQLTSQQRMILADRLMALKPAIVTYLTALATDRKEYDEKRATYAKVIVDKFIQSLEDNLDNGLAEAENITQLDLKNLRGLAEVAYPNERPQMPIELEGLIGQIIGSSREEE